MSSATGSRDVLRAGVAGLSAALVVAGLVLWWGGGITERGAFLGLPDPGPVTQWALPLSRVLMDLAAAVTVGLLLAAVVLAPRRVGTEDERWVMGPHAYRWVRAAGWTTLGWLGTAVLSVIYTISDILGQSVGQFIGSPAAWSVALDLEQLQVLLWVVAVTAILAVACRIVLSVRGAAALLLLALFGILPPAFGGHSAGSGSHQLAVSAMLLHVVGVVLWAGGLLALLLTWQLSTSDLRRGVHRYSRLAGWCLVLVAASGMANILGRIGRASALGETNYGLLVIAKILALAALAGLGLLHRRRTIPVLDRGHRGLFIRLAAVEFVVFAAAIGLAVGLSRTPPPTGAPETDTVKALLGFPMPDRPNAASLLLDWLPEPIFFAMTAAAVGFYLAGVRRLRRRGETWPFSRVVAWLSGWTLIVLLTTGGLARYGYVLFSAHLVQHLALVLVVPALLVLGFPVTLALRTLETSSDPCWPGPREWLRSTLRLPLVRFLLRPHVAMGIQATVLAAVYFGGFYEFALRSHAAHLTMSLLVPAAGYVLLWSTTGLDEATYQFRRPHQLALLGAYVAMPALLGLALLRTETAIAESWYLALHRPWGGTALADQHLGGSIALWAGGATSGLIALVLLATGYRAQIREAVRSTPSGATQESSRHGF